MPYESKTILQNSVTLHKENITLYPWLPHCPISPHISSHPPAPLSLSSDQAPVPFSLKMNFNIFRLCLHVLALLHLLYSLYAAPPFHLEMLFGYYRIILKQSCCRCDGMCWPGVFLSVVFSATARNLPRNCWPPTQIAFNVSQSIQPPVHPSSFLIAINMQVYCRPVNFPFGQKSFDKLTNRLLMRTILWWNHIKVHNVTQLNDRPPLGQHAQAVRLPELSYVYYYYHRHMWHQRVSSIPRCIESSSTAIVWGRWFRAHLPAAFTFGLPCERSFLYAAHFRPVNTLRFVPK